MTNIPITLLHANDTRLISLAERIGSNFPDIEVGENATEWSALAASPHFSDSIVILDAEFDDGVSRSDRIREIRALGARVITLSSIDDPKAVIQDMAAGADAALRKSESSRRVADQIRLAANRARLIRERG